MATQAVRIAALEAQVSVLNTLCEAQRAQIAALESKLATRGHIATKFVAPSRPAPRADVAAYFAAYPQARSCTPAQLAEFSAIV